MISSRRTFLKYAGNLTLGAALIPVLKRPAFPFDQTKSREVLVGAHPWIYTASLGDHDITPILETIFQDMIYAGMDGIEMMEQPLRSHQVTLQIQDLVNKYGLPVIGTTYEADMWDKSRHAGIVDDVDLITDNLGRLEGRTMGISVGLAPEKKSNRQLDDQAELVRQLISMCQLKGITLHFHNHGYTVENDMYDLKEMLKRIPDLKLGPDIGGLVEAGVNPEKFIKQYEEKIVFYHLSDLNENGLHSESIGEGDIDLKLIGKTIRKVKFSGDLIIELKYDEGFEPTRPIRDSLRMSREHIRNNLGY